MAKGDYLGLGPNKQRTDAFISRAKHPISPCTPLQCQFSNQAHPTNFLANYIISKWNDDNRFSTDYGSRQNFRFEIPEIFRVKRKGFFQ